jgi:hypothetical protein
MCNRGPCGRLPTSSAMALDAEPAESIPNVRQIITIEGQPIARVSRLGDLD